MKCLIGAKSIDLDLPFVPVDTQPLLAADDAH